MDSSPKTTRLVRGFCAHSASRENVMKSWTLYSILTPGTGRSLIAMIVLAVCTPLVCAAQASPVIDQQFIPIGTLSELEASVQPFALGPSYGQTFTVGISGQLVGADLILDAALLVFLGHKPNDVLVEVTTTVGGFPTSNVIVSGIISGTSIPAVFSSHLDTFTHVNFSSAPTVTAGQQLALLFFGEGDLVNDPNIVFQHSSSILYAGGQAEIFAFGSWHPAIEFFEQGQAGSDDFAFRTYIDTTPPTIVGMPVAPCTIWPPNHKLVQIAAITATDIGAGLAPGSPSVSVASNEPVQPGDIVITNGVVQVAADRLGNGNGRVYTVVARASDLAGNTATATGTCRVPHDQGK